MWNTNRKEAHDDGDDDEFASNGVVVVFFSSHDRDENVITFKGLFA